MPRQRTPEPRLFALGDKFPKGPFQPDTPVYALAAALFAVNLSAYMDGTLRIYGKDPEEFVIDSTVYSLAKKAEVGRAILSRILKGSSYPDMTTVAKLEAYCSADLWGTDAERRQLLAGTYDPSIRDSK